MLKADHSETCNYTHQSNIREQFHKCWVFQVEQAALRSQLAFLLQDSNDTNQPQHSLSC